MISQHNYTLSGIEMSKYQSRVPEISILYSWRWIEWSETCCVVPLFWRVFILFTFSMSCVMIQFLRTWVGRLFLKLRTLWWWAT